MHEYKADFDWLARESKLLQLGRLELLGHKPPTKDMSLDEMLKLDPLPIFRREKTVE